MEQQERKRRQMMNKEFKAFSEKIAEASTSSVGFDTCPSFRSTTSLTFFSTA